MVCMQTIASQFANTHAQIADGTTQYTRSGRTYLVWSFLKPERGNLGSWPLNLTQEGRDLFIIIEGVDLLLLILGVWSPVASWLY